MIESTGPQLICRPLKDFTIGDWKSIEAAFVTSDSCELRQAWCDEPETEFQPARVSIGWRDNSLCVYAELCDRDIFNDSTFLNDATYAKGDLFEILLRPVEQHDYFEFHVTPENQQLQLHWPDADAVWKFDNRHESLQPYFISEPMLRSHTLIEHDVDRWRVLAIVPASVMRPRNIEDGNVWAFSFSRYDYMLGQSEPVLSSCSPHVQPRFHRQQEWGRLTFVK